MKRLAPNRRASGNARERHLILGLLHDETHRPFVVSYAQNHGRRYRYYVSNHRSAASGAEGRSRASPWRLPADTIEPIVEDLFRAILSDRTRLATWAGQHDALPHLAAVLENAKALTTRFTALDDLAAKSAILRHIIRRIIMGQGQITIEIMPGRLVQMLMNPVETAPQLQEESKAATSFADVGIEPITLPLTIKRRGVESRIVLDGVHQQKAAPDQDLIALIGKAHLYLQLLTDGSGTNIADLCRIYGLSNSDISRILPMAFLSPKITEAILTGMQPADLTVAKLTRMLELPVEWQAQQEILSM
ncbi:hypothetical protein NBH19_11670 [Rhizobium sp. S95]|uniref:Uncharacterized protein n=1 Tax=Ciceribacter sichuanensis TaxID=2949647 RepID=A0AAJ1F8K2_9HYPH|nr:MULTISPECIES: hypothetical protein [unclassified Ciceribacter]MCM2396730.1 hypothetical protein [Ciceribacter sp. S95]MCO5958178.1 hypothetical protein [Ciceribacter sp. S101]